VEVTRKLTVAQRRVLSMIKRYARKHGFPPTRQDICDEMGFASPNAAQEHLEALARKRAVKLTPGISRGIRVTA
jgi:repressor LexA